MTRLVIVSLAVLTALCSGTGCYHGRDADAPDGAAEDGDAGDGADGDGDGDGGWDDDGTAAECDHPELRGHANAGMRRLTREELLQSIEAIVGATVMQAPEVVEAAATIPSESPGDLVADFQNGHAIEHVGGLLRTAEAVAGRVAEDADARDAVFGSCASAADLACAEAFLDARARRILGRPLDDERRVSLLAGFSGEGEGLHGMRWLLARLLQSPEFVFHLELPRGPCEPDDAACPDDPPEGLIAVDDWSVASRLAYALTGQGPDDELLEAAERGQLRTRDQVRPHAERLVATPAARRQLRSMLDSWLLLATLPKPNATLAELAGIDPEGLDEEARQELLDYATYLVFDLDADASALLDTPVGFPRSERMAAIYGTEIADGQQPVPLPDGHGGLLLRAAPLLSGHRHTSPILRGAYVRKRLLCDEVPPPDPAAVADGLAELDAADRTTMSTREIVEQVTAPALCAGCHQLVNPLGFTLESFDPLARRRSEEIVYDADGNELAHHPIDTHVDDPILEPDGPAALDGPVELGAALAGSDKVKACIAQRLYTHVWLRPAEDADDCAIAQVRQALIDGKSVKQAWLDAVVTFELTVRVAEDSP